MLHTISVQNMQNSKSSPFLTAVEVFSMCFLFPIYFCIPFTILNVFLSRKALFLSWSAVILSLALGNSLLKFILGHFVVCLVCKGRMSISENAAFFCVCVPRRIKKTSVQSPQAGSVSVN